MADKDSAADCPVDHKTRDAWLAHARAAESSKPQPAACPVDHQQAPAQPRSWAATLTSYLPWPSSSSPAPTEATVEAPGLGTSRVVSTIPRSSGPDGACPVDHAPSANAETETGAHASGNWVYPSEKMFFEAMRRKGHDPRETDMTTVVPIHNAVNERAWKEIREWEAPYLATSKYDP